MISSAQAELDTYPLDLLVSDSPAISAVMTSAALQGGKLRYETPLSAMAVDAAELDGIKCDEGIQAAPRTIHLGGHRLAIQCQRYDTAPTIKAVFDAISGGRTFFAHLATKDDGEPQFILVYAVKMLYAGIPKMVRLYYLELGDNKLGSMSAKDFFDRTSGGVEMRIRTW